MTDEWEFRTARGRGRVAGGVLRLENTLLGMARKPWADHEAKGRLLFLFTTVTTLASVGRLADSGRELLAGAAEPWQTATVAAFAFVGFALVRRLLRTRTVPLGSVRSAARVDDDRIRVTYADEDADHPRGIADLEIETLTEADADEAVELLRLKGVRVADSPEEVESASRTFRERLAKKTE